MLGFGEELRLRPARRVAICAGATVRIEADPARLVEAVNEYRPEIVLFDLDHGGPAALRLARDIVERAPAARIIALCHPSPPRDLAELLGEPWFDHLIGLESPWFMDELAATLAKLAGRPIHGLAPYLAWATRVIDIEVTGSADKERAFEAVEVYMQALGIRGRLVQRLQAVADEMLMNAVYDAPTDRATGEALHAARSRTEPVELALADRPTFRFGSDGQVFALSIQDPFGALTPGILRRYLAKGLRRGDDQIDRKAGGAGLGLYLMFDMLHSMCLNLTPGHRTELLGLVDIRGSYRDVVQAPKSLNLFVGPGVAP